MTTDATHPHRGREAMDEALALGMAAPEAYLRLRGRLAASDAPQWDVERQSLNLLSAYAARGLSRAEFDRLRRILDPRLPNLSDGFLAGIERLGREYTADEVAAITGPHQLAWECLVGGRVRAIREQAAARSPRPGAPGEPGRLSAAPIGFAPTGTTEAAGGPDDAAPCAVCHAEGWHNPGAGEVRCARHWDEY